MSGHSAALEAIRARDAENADVSPSAMPKKIRLLRELLEKSTPGHWSACGDGKCSCKTVWCPDHPVAEIVQGDWGDEYPAIRLVGTSSLDQKAEAYMEQITYGTIPDEVAEANARLIVLLHTLAPVFLEKFEREFS